MGKYLKNFNTHSEYLAFTQTSDFILPNVSHCVDNNEVHYNPWTWADEYFTTVVRENGAISFNIQKSMGTDKIYSISYSTDNGKTWTTTKNTNNREENLVIDVNVNNGDKVMWKGDATQLGFWDLEEGDAYGSFFSSDCEFDAQGNVMSLLYGDDFKGETTIENDNAFARLFTDYFGEKVCKVVNAKNLSLPATTLTSGCYYNMFLGCMSLTSAPELPATTLAGVAFDGCYEGMFYGCTSLVTAPGLPATTLAENCYNTMFDGCTSLVTAPELPATTLTSGCYSGMFRDCTSLNYIKAMFTTTPSNKYTYNWVKGVAASGTFVKNKAATWDVSGIDGIPNGWTVETATA